jgi:hypothetical protein
MVALSATYPEYLANHLTAYMRNPTFVRLNVLDPALLGKSWIFKLIHKRENNSVYNVHGCRVVQKMIFTTGTCNFGVMSTDLTEGENAK